MSDAADPDDKSIPVVRGTACSLHVEPGAREDESGAQEGESGAQEDESGAREDDTASLVADGAAAECRDSFAISWALTLRTRSRGTAPRAALTGEAAPASELLSHLERVHPRRTARHMRTRYPFIFDGR